MRRVRQYNNPRRSVAQPGSASGLGPEGREFESLHSDHPPLIIGNLARPKLCGWWREKPVAIRRCHSIKRGSPTVHDSGVGFMARARIYKPCKTSMQSGRKAQVTRGNAWVLEYPRSAVVRPDPLMGWQSRRHGTAGSCPFPRQGQRHRLCRGAGDRVPGHRAEAAPRQAEGLCRQFRLHPQRGLDALDGIVCPAWQTGFCWTFRTGSGTTRLFGRRRRRPPHGRWFRSSTG